MTINELEHCTVSELECRIKSNKNTMRLMLVVFIGCLLGLGLTLVVILNDYQFLWLIPYLFVMIGQWWLMNGGRWRK